MTERKRAAAINADSGEQHDVRLDYAAAAPDAIEAMRGLEKVVGSGTLAAYAWVSKVGLGVVPSGF